MDQTKSTQYHIYSERRVLRAYIPLRIFFFLLKDCLLYHIVLVS